MATKKAINQAISQANTTACAKFIAPLRDFVYKHIQRACTPMSAYKRFLSANQRVLKAAYKHDAQGFIGDEQAGRWCPRNSNYTYAAPLKVSIGSLSTLPFIYDPVAHCYYCYGVNMPGSPKVGAWAREWGVNGGDIFSIVFVTLLRERAANYPEEYNWHNVDQLGVITLRVDDDVRRDTRPIAGLLFDQVFQILTPGYENNFHFPISKHFRLVEILNDPDWVIFRQGFGLETVGCWTMVHSRRSLKSHSTSQLHLENQRLFGMSYVQMLEDYL